VTCIEIDECSVCPSVRKPDEIADLMMRFVLENRRITVYEVATVLLGISSGSV